MAGFLDFILSNNNGLDTGALDNVRRQGFLNAGVALANMSAPQAGGYKATPMQLIAGGLGAFQQGANNGIEQYYKNDVLQTQAAQGAVQRAADAENLNWFKNRGGNPNSGYQRVALPATGLPSIGSFYGRPNSLTQAQIQQESGGNPNAVSPKGARGLMQIMPATGTNPGFGVQPMRNASPEENVRIGQDYTDAMLKKYNGDQALALMAYNWGPGNVDNWLASGADPAQVPDETKQYVQNILQTQPQQPQMAMAQGNPERSRQLFDLAEAQMRAGRAGADTLFRVAQSYDPTAAQTNNINTPAVVQIANEIAKARQAGDKQREKDLVALSKIYDKGMAPGADGKIETLPGYGDAKRRLSYEGKAGEKEAESDINRLKTQSEVVAKLPLLESDLASYKAKLATIDPALMGPLRGTVSYYTSPEIQELTSNARSIALQLKDIYNLGSGQGFTDADRNYLDSIIGGAKVDPIAAISVLEDMQRRISVQKDIYTQTTNYYNENNSLSGFIPNVQPADTTFDQVTPGGLKFRIVQ